MTRRLHIGGRQAGIEPNHQHDRNVDDRENVHDHARDGEHAQKRDQAAPRWRRYKVGAGRDGRKTARRLFPQNRLCFTAAGIRLPRGKMLCCRAPYPMLPERFYLPKQAIRPTSWNSGADHSGPVATSSPTGRVRPKSRPQEGRSQKAALPRMIRAPNIPPSTVGAPSKARVSGTPPLAVIGGIRWCTGEGGIPEGINGTRPKRALLERNMQMSLRPSARPIRDPRRFYFRLIRA